MISLNDLVLSLCLFVIYFNIGYEEIETSLFGMQTSLKKPL